MRAKSGGESPNNPDATKRPVVLYWKQYKGADTRYRGPVGTGYQVRVQEVLY